MPAPRAISFSSSSPPGGRPSSTAAARGDARPPIKPSGTAWLGDIPEEWSIQYLFQLAGQVKNLNTDLAETNLLSLSYGKIKRKSIDSPDGLLPASFDGYNIIEKGDVVLRLTDLQNDQTSLRVGQAQERGIITSAYTTVRPRRQEIARYLFYALDAFDLAKGFYGMGSGVRQGLNWAEVKHLELPFPTLPEQRAIAAFLDDKCAAIDALADEAKASLSEYADWKRSIIFHAVTKGIPADGGGRLSPAAAARGDARPPMKDSGVEWIGNIPAHWQCTRVGRLFSDILGKMLANEPATKSDTFEPYVCAKDVHFSGIDTSNLKKMWFSPDERELYRTRDTDLLVVEGGAGAGGAAVVSDGGGYFIQNSIHLVRAKHPLASTFYLRYWIFAAVSQGYIGFICNRATIPHFTKEKLLNMPMPLPPLTEQRAIAAWLDEKCAAIDALVEEKKKLIEDLGAYKKSLIYQTVTGKRRIKQCRKHKETLVNKKAIR